MQIVVAGVSHREAALEVRERLAVPDAALDGELSALRQRVSEGFILSTCHRVEVYALCGHEGSGADLLRSFLLRREPPSSPALDLMYVHTGADAVRHAFRVSAGLDSMVVGEHQIQAQVRRALAAARGAGLLGPTIDRLGDAALACGKRVRATTSLGRHAVSLASLAVRAAAERMERLAPRVLVIGAGEMAALVLRDLPVFQPDAVEIVSRSPVRADALAAANGATAVPFADLENALSRADVVFACTTAPGFLVTREKLARVREGRAEPMLLMDLGVPRDVEPAAGELAGVSVVYIDELSAVATEHLATHATDLNGAEAIVDAEVARYSEWLATRRVAAAIGRVHAHGQSVVETELARALARLSDLPPRDRRIVRDLAQRIAGKLLHQPTVVLKQHPEADNLALALEAMFGVPGARDRLDELLPRAHDACDVDAHGRADDEVA